MPATPQLNAGDVIVIEHRHPSGAAHQVRARVTGVRTITTGPRTGRTAVGWLDTKPVPAGQAATGGEFIIDTDHPFGTKYVRTVLRQVTATGDTAPDAQVIDFDTARAGRVPSPRRRVRRRVGAR